MKNNKFNIDRDLTTGEEIFVDFSDMKAMNYNFNIIGAPGTGKTHLIKQIVSNLMESNKLRGIYYEGTYERDRGYNMV